MINKIIKLFITSTISFFAAMTFGVAHGEEPTCEIGGELTKAYIEQADSCKNGKKVESYNVMYLVEDEDGIEKLQALLEHDCIEGFRNSIGVTIADDWARNSELSSSCLGESEFFRSWICYFLEKLHDLVADEEFFEEQKKARELRDALKLLVNSEWFTENMRDRIGLTEFDVALLRDDREGVVSMLDAMSNMKDNTPSKNAELLRFMTSSKSVLQYLVKSHENYSRHLVSSHIKDPSLDTVVMISGPGGRAWSYSIFNHAIGIIEKLGLNWILIGDGVRSYSLRNLEQRIEPLLSGLEGKVLFWINGHGQVNEEVGGHVIEFHKLTDVKTRELFEILKTACGNKAIDVILDSCYSGAAYKDAIEVFSEGSRFLSSAPVDAPSVASGKLMLNGVDHFLESRKVFNSAFELFSLGYLYETLDVKEGPQIFTSVSNIDSFVLKLDKASIDFEYVFENQEMIINYLKGYLDEETLELVKAFIDLQGKPLAKDSYIDEENLSRIVQYAVAMTLNDKYAFKEGINAQPIVNEDAVDDCEKLLMYEDYELCKYKQRMNILKEESNRLRKRVKKLEG